MLVAFGQNDSVFVKKDTLLIQYIPVYPTTYQKADAWYMHMLNKQFADTTINVFKTYKQYYEEKRGAFKLYSIKTTIANEGELNYKTERVFLLPNKDLLFYVVFGILLLYGIIHNLYPQYYAKLFSQFSQSSFRMIQNREQLVQSELASLFTNINFIVSISLLTTLLLFKWHLLTISFWKAYLFIGAFYMTLYLGKFICLQLVGYILDQKEIVNTYLFVVFLVNKMMGILLVPFILLLAFSKPIFSTIAIYGALFLTVLLFLYRYIFSVSSVRNQLHISSFHFFLYLCAFEILPLLILYKLIVQYFGGTF
jgi:hypothetical protein